jgi:hypothetical protein
VLNILGTRIGHSGLARVAVRNCQALLTNE